MPDIRVPVLNLSHKLPEVTNQLFLSRTGVVGLRCRACGFVMSGRSLTEIKAQVWEHDRFAHLPAEAELAQNAEEPRTS